MTQRPTALALILFAVGIPVALLPILIDARLWGLWAMYLAACGVALLLDGLFMLPARRLDLTIETPPFLYIGAQLALTAQLRVARGTLPADGFDALCELDPELVPQPQMRVGVIDEPALQFEVPLVPRRRGQVRIAALWLRWRGPWGLMCRVLRHPIDREIAVIPNVLGIRDAALRFFSNREFLAGMKRERYIGDGSEFESLREYLPGLDHRAMDWKASARRRKLLCREFEAERNHQVVLAYDTGHLMREPIAGIPRLDHAINAGLLLSYVCLRTGDRVGMYAFDAKVRAFNAPQGGMHSLAVLQHATADLDYSADESNFTLALTDLSTRMRRRSLIVLLTEFVDTVTAQLMLENVERLSRRHLVIFVAIRDPWLAETTSAEPTDLLQLERAVVARTLATERELVVRKLERMGVRCVSASPRDVSVRLLNTYLDIKRRELI
ncbi:MAG: DUF58 domain-containing protein [Planctomycetota bacterium]